LRDKKVLKTDLQKMAMQELPDLIACEECDAVYRRIALGRDEVAFCRCCGAELERDMSSHSRRVLPLTLAGLFMYIIANAFPIVEMELHGLVNQATLMGSVLALNAEGMHLVAFLVLATTILFPLIQLLALIYLLTSRNISGSRAGRSGYPIIVNLLARMIQTLRPWVMVEIFLLGVIVAFVKMTSMATVLPGAALWALGALTFLFAAVLSFNPRYIWRKSISEKGK
jgi:paraquat-inducible protein A